MGTAGAGDSAVRSSEATVPPRRDSAMILSATRVALVTGGGRGIGAAIAFKLAQAGLRVAISYHRDAASAEATVKRIAVAGGTARAYQAAVEDMHATDRMVEEVGHDLGAIGVLVNNAGITSRGLDVADTDIDEVLRLLSIHAVSVHQLCRRTVPAMRDLGRGDIVMISSQSSSSLPAGGAPYNMAKAAMEALAATLAKEERRNGIRVNTVAPGLVATEMGRRYVRAAFGSSGMAALAADSPFGRVCTVDDVAALVAYLVSDDGSYITGQRIAVDGGDWRDVR